MERRLDKINEKLSIEQYTDGFAYGTDAVLISAFCRCKKGERGADIGTGTGIIPILITHHKKVEKMFAFEIQKDYARLAEDNVARCGMCEKITVINDDIKNITPSYMKQYGVEALDFVVTNPPYMKITSGALGLNERKIVARHEKHCDIYDVARAGASLIKNGGSMYIIYRPDRLCDMIHALRENNLEPKEMVLVKSFEKDKAPCLVMCQARKAGESSLKISELVIYSEENVYTKQMQEVYERSEMSWLMK